MQWTEENVGLLLILSGAVFSVLLTIALVYARKAAQALAKVANIQLTEAQLKSLEGYVTLAIGAVQEQSDKYLKGLVADAPQTSTQKQAEALKVARSIAPDSLQAFSDDAIKLVVDAKVQERRLSIPPSTTTISFPPPASRAVPPGRAS